MKQLHKVLKISAKESFKNLQSTSPYFQQELQKEIHITQVFWNYINFSKDRELKELIQRLSFFSLITRIFQEGKITHQKNKFIKTTLCIQSICFSVIIIKNSYRYTLLSCFIEHNKKHLVSP